MAYNDGGPPTMLLTITNIGTGDFVLQDPSGISLFTVKVSPGETKLNLKVSADTFGYLEPVLESAVDALHITYEIADDPDSLADDPMYSVRVVTTSPVVVTIRDEILIFKMAVPGPVAVSLPATLPKGKPFQFIDGLGDAATNNITITPVGATIKGAATLVIDTAYGAATLTKTEATQWSVAGSAGGGGGSLPAFTGTDGAALFETGNPTPFAVFRPIEAADIAPAFAITSFSPTASLNRELGDPLVNPAFTSAANAAITTPFTIFDGTNTDPISLAAQAAFGYNNGGASGLPARSYTGVAIDQSQGFTLSSKKNPSGPIDTAGTSGNIGRIRIFTGLSITPGAYDTAFIGTFGVGTLQSGFVGTYVFGSGGGTQRIYIIYATAYGSPATIKDSGGFAFPMVVKATGVLVANAFIPAIPGGYTILESGITIVPFTITLT